MNLRLMSVSLRPERMIVLTELATEGSGTAEGIARRVGMLEQLVLPVLELLVMQGLVGTVAPTDWDAVYEITAEGLRVLYATGEL